MLGCFGEWLQVLGKTGGVEWLTVVRDLIGNAMAVYVLLGRPEMMVGGSVNVRDFWVECVRFGVRKQGTPCLGRYELVDWIGERDPGSRLSKVSAGMQSTGPASFNAGQSTGLGLVRRVLFSLFMYCCLGGSVHSCMVGCCLYELLIC